MSDDLRDANIALVRRYWDAMNAWDFDAMAEMLSDDAVFEVPFLLPGWKRRHAGREKVMKAFIGDTSLIEGSLNVRILKADTLASDPNEVFITYASDTKFKNGAKYANEYVGLYKIRDGKICWLAEYFDPIRIVLSLGGTVELPTPGQ